jgi:hypothetical protein
MTDGGAFVSPCSASPVWVSSLTLASLDSAAQTGAPQLTVRVIGPGKVSSAPPGVDCQPDCGEPFPRQRTGPQVVTLTAVPGPGQISTTG